MRLITPTGEHTGNRDRLIVIARTFRASMTRGESLLITQDDGKGSTLLVAGFNRGRPALLQYGESMTAEQYRAMHPLTPGP